MARCLRVTAIALIYDVLGVTHDLRGNLRRKLPALRVNGRDKHFCIFTYDIQSMTRMRYVQQQYVSIAV